MRYSGPGSEFFQNLATDQQQHFIYIYIYFSVGHRAVGQELHREVPEQEVTRSVLKINLCILTSIGYYP